MHVYQWKESKWRGLFTYKGHPKNQHNQIILAFELAALNLKGILTIAVFLDSIQSETMEHKIWPHVRSWDDKSVSEVALIYQRQAQMRSIYARLKTNNMQA